MVLFLSILLLCYLVFMVGMTIGWNTLSPGRTSGHDLNLSVVVAVRNEEKNIKNLLSDLFDQTLSKKNYEVIIVDDHSEDETVPRVEEFIKTHAEMHLRVWPSTENGKKKALRIGQFLANSVNIITTDGDCRVGKNWLKNYQREFSNEDVKMICGPVSYRENSTLFSRLQSLEFAGLIGLGAAGLRFNMPNMCNGANLGFRKYAFELVNGYSDNLEIPSGDDEFLMHKIYSTDPGSVRFIKDRDSIVYTDPHPSLKAFIYQRRRWASKWSHYRLDSPKRMAVFAFSVYLFLILSFLFACFGIYPWKALAIQVAFKLVVDVVFLGSVMHFLKKRLNPLIFLLMELLYPPYVVIFGLLSNIGSYEWKGRKIS